MIKTFVEFINEKKNEDVGKELVEQYGKYKVYTVNGEKVRDLTKGDEEFGLSSSYPYFPNLIPKNEIWIEDDVKTDERNILIHIELYKLKLIDNGMEKWDAYHKAEKMDKKYREERDKNPEKTDEKGHEKIYKKEYCKIKDDDLTVWLVDAEMVRDKYKTDFMEGGHGYVYKWIPNNEIWIEDGLKDKEIPFVLIHEYVERTLMKEKGMKYDNAHNIAAKVEWSKRPDKLTKNDMVNMTEEEALKLGNEFKK
jgi:hypothetical protein